jgi:hypothetical protein
LVPADPGRPTDLKAGIVRVDSGIPVEQAIAGHWAAHFADRWTGM